MDSSPRVLLHIDMDAFFASVEVLSNPSLRGRPLVVGGVPGHRGVVSTASYEARRFGIEPGMAISEAFKRCPEATFLPGSPSKYIFNSIRLLDLLRRFSPLLEPFSIDEAFVEITGHEIGLHDGQAVASRIQTAIEGELGITASIGVGPNKLIAKMASRVIKPRGLTVLNRETFCDHFWPRPVDDLWGIGTKTAAALNLLGISTIGELAQTPRPPLMRAFGVVGGALKEMAQGRDDTPLIPYFQGVPVKSMGHEYTFPRDESDPRRLEAVLYRLTEQVARRLRLGGKAGRTVTVKIRFDDFRTITRQRTMKSPTDEERVVFPVVRDLLHANARGERLRLIGVSVSGLSAVSATSLPLDLFPPDIRNRRVLSAVDALRDRFGENVMTRAKTLASPPSPVTVHHVLRKISKSSG
jgi:DNA polymerase-4